MKAEVFKFTNEVDGTRVAIPTFADRGGGLLWNTTAWCGEEFPEVVRVLLGPWDSERPTPVLRSKGFCGTEGGPELMKDVVGELEPDMLRSKEGTTSTSLTFFVGRGGGELFDDELLLKPAST